MDTGFWTFGGHLYDKLSIDKFGRWKELLGESQLRDICSRVNEELEDWPTWQEILMENEEYNEDYNELERFKDALGEIGFTWNKDTHNILYNEEPLDTTKFRQLRPL